MLKPPQFSQVEVAEIAAIKAIHALATSDYIQLRTSFCEKHRHYWTIKKIVMFGGVALFFFSMFLTAALGLAATINRRDPHPILAGMAVCCAVIGFFGFIIPLVIVWRRPIRAFGLDKGLVVVDNVSDAYADAVKATRRPQEPETK
ncbi:MAG TPA: hypothetical protein VFE62_00130 [Gemmataceae bacterium]|nr:hypothetical protein [Gemmataceae bacterium]